MILKMLTVGFIATNCYVVGSDKSRQGMVIDPGAEAKSILKAVESLNLKLKCIVLTHSHFDHTGAVKAIKDATSAEFVVGAGPSKLSPGAFVKLMAAMSGGSANIPEPDRMLNDGDSLEIDDLSFRIISTPGHSQDGVCLYGEGVLFSGDTLFNMGVGRTDFPGCSEEQLFHSIKQKLYVLPGDTLVYPGHGPATTIGDEKANNPFVV
jgi:glyoxylase-like metal-dependent hydrolase (beta-lactamase superfamily II)